MYAKYITSSNGSLTKADKQYSFILESKPTIYASLNLYIHGIRDQ